MERKKIASFLFAVLLIGCAVTPVPTSQTTGKLDNLKSNLIDAQSNTKAGATPAQVATANRDIINSLPIVDSVKSDVTANGKVIADLQAYKTKEEQAWLGPRAHRLMDWIIGIGVALGIGWLLLVIASNMEGGWLAGVVNVAGHILTGGLSLIKSGVEALIGKLVYLVPKVSSATASLLAKLAPNPPAPKPAVPALPVIPSTSGS